MSESSNSNGKQNKARSFDKNNIRMEGFLESTEKSFWTGTFPWVYNEKSLSSVSYQQ